MPLGNLLGLVQAAAVGAPDPLADDPQTRNPASILVDADKTDPYALENVPNINQRDVALESSQEASNHKGMFGVKGTLRDVLGLVGDAFLIQGGNKPIYAAQREQEKLSDAMAGLTENPVAAIERVAGLNPAAAQKMYDEYLLNQNRVATNALSAINTNIAKGRETRANLDHVTDQASRLLSAALRSNNPTLVQDVMLQISDMAEKYGVSLEDVGLNVGMSPDQLQAYADAGMTPYQQSRIPQMQESLNLRRNEEAGRTTRFREGQAGQDRRLERTEAARDRRFQQSEEGKDRRSQQTGGGGPRPLRGSTQSPASSLRIRPVGQ